MIQRFLIINTGELILGNKWASNKTSKCFLPCSAFLLLKPSLTCPQSIPTFLTCVDFTSTCYESKSQLNTKISEKNYLNHRTRVRIKSFQELQNSHSALHQVEYLCVNRHTLNSPATQRLFSLLTLIKHESFYLHFTSLFCYSLQQVLPSKNRRYNIIINNKPIIFLWNKQKMCRCVIYN